MKKRLFLTLLTATTLLSSTVVEAYHNDGKHRNRSNYRRHYQQARDYYPQQPQYLHSPVHKSVTPGVLGSVLGYEIAKDDAVATELGSVDNGYLKNSVLKKR